MPLHRQVPNQLTILRLPLAGAFFLAVNQYRYPPTDRENCWLLVSLGLFVLAALTDLLDGYLARRWKVESAFGRVMDPFCDKVLILGAFIYLSGPRFSIEQTRGAQEVIVTITGVYPWMVVLMLARELLVTGIRGWMEEQGGAFGAKTFGKLKMAMQSIGIPMILLIVWLDPRASGREWLAYPRDILVYSIVAVTVVSVLPYLPALGEASKSR